MWDDNEESRRGDDWKQWKRGWQYKQNAPKDPEWQKTGQNYSGKTGMAGGGSKE